MAIRFAVGGIEIECDTPDEAVGLIRVAQAEIVPNGKKPRKTRQIANDEAPSANGAGDVRGFWEELPDDARALLAALRDSKTLSTAELSGRTGIEPPNLKYKIRSITAIATKHGLQPSGFVISEKGYSGGKPASTYHMADSAKQTLATLA